MAVMKFNYFYPLFPPNSQIVVIIKFFQTVKAFLPAMIESNKGHIVNIASIAGLMGCPIIVDYCTSKYAVVGFSDALQMELDVCNLLNLGYLFAVRNTD